jgi:FkbM family methyltransferase
MKQLGTFLEKLGHRVSTLGYIVRNPTYAAARRGGAARDLYRLLNRGWLRPEHIGTVLDVGANEGQFIHIARLLFPRASILAFEPNPRLLHSLKELLVPDQGDALFAVACGREAATMPLHLAAFSPASSLLHASDFQAPGFPAIKAAETVQVRVERLDQILARSSPPPAKPYLLKLDVQGFELEVLRGATGILPEVAVIVCEVNTAPFYEGQAPFEEIYAFLREHHFRLVDVGEPIRAGEDGEVVYFDVAFRNTRDTEAIRSSAS